MLKTVVCLSVLLCHIWVAYAASKLETYNVDRSSVTVSGLSSGGAMAMQLHFAFSKDIHGAGIVAGLPYACAKGGLISANMCMYSPGTVNVANLITEINNQAYAGKIDLTSNVQGDKVFIFHGTKDTTVNPAAAGKTKEIYERFGAVVQSELTLGAVHGFPTDFYGAACGSSSAMTQYINNCNYHGAYQVLNYLYNNTLVPPTGSTTLADLKEYDQGEFGGSAASSMDSTGFVYVPSGCRDRTQKCKFHISLHGCSQSKATIQNIYATKTGYLEVAELNNIIVIFPQATANIMAGNPNACWDWWGYLNVNFLNKDGAQMKAIQRMMTRVAHCDGAESCYEDGVVTTTTPPPTGPTTTTTQGPTTTVDPTNPCRDNEVSFHPLPGMCEYYTMCACGAQVLLHCAPGLYFDPSINNCNFIQLVPCENST